MKNFFILLALLFPFLNLNAQWNANVAQNLQIADSNASDLKVATTSDGKTWIAFHSNRAGNYDMRVQLLDKNGVKLLGENGALASNFTSGSATYVFNISVDSEDVGSSRVDLQACKLEYSIVSPK